MDNNNAEKIELLQHAAALLDAEALAVREGHTLDHTNPDWSGEAEAKVAHDDMRNTSTQLRAMATELSQPAQSAVVPIEPTDEMLDAAARASMQHLIDCINDPSKADEIGSDENIRKTHASRYRAMLAAAPSASASQTAIAQELSDDEVAKVLASLGIDTYPSKYGFEALQVSATSVPMIHKIVAAYLAALPSQSEPSIDRVTPEMRADLADMQREMAEVGEGIAALADESQSEPVSDDMQASALTIVHEEAGRTLSRDDFDLCVRIAKRCLADAAQTRNAAYERCAKICDDYSGGWYVHNQGAKECARAIRMQALIESSPRVAQEPASLCELCRDDKACMKRMRMCAGKSDAVLTQPSEKGQADAADEQKAFTSAYADFAAGRIGTVELWAIAVNVGLALSASQQASERDKEDAARYRVLRMHVAPAWVTESMGLGWCDLIVGEKTEDRIDRLCDTILMLNSDEQNIAARAAQEKKA